MKSPYKIYVSRMYTVQDVAQKLQCNGLEGKFWAEDKETPAATPLCTLSGLLICPGLHTTTISVIRERAAADSPCCSQLLHSNATALPTFIFGLDL